MDEASTGQVNSAAAQIYESFFVPALFGEAAHAAVSAANVQNGQRVLDVACGTGIVARTAAQAGAAAIGVDRNAGMLAVAKSIAPQIEWKEGLAERLPFEDARFDAVFCNFGLMFFEDREAALREMWRVTKRGGAIVIATWDVLERTAGYNAMTELLRRMFGDEAANAMRAPFVLGDPEALGALVSGAVGADTDVRTANVTAHFASLEDWMHTDIRGWTLADMIDDDQFQALIAAARTELARFVGPDGAVSFPSPAHLAVARKA